jgi:hypothetical protein
LIDVSYFVRARLRRKNIGASRFRQALTSGEGDIKVVRLTGTSTVLSEGELCPDSLLAEA